MHLVHLANLDTCCSFDVADRQKAEGDKTDETAEVDKA